MRKLLLPLIFILSGCGDNPDPNDSNASTTKQTIFSVKTDNTTINRLLPLIRTRLPGLDKYASQFQKISVEDDYWLTIKFHIPDDAQIPVDYMAFGHNCFIEINKEATAVKLPKTACKAVMLDQNADGIDSEQWFDISAEKAGSPSVVGTLKREILPPTLDDKPPRSGCLKVYSPNEETRWSCPIN